MLNEVEYPSILIPSPDDSLVVDIMRIKKVADTVRESYRETMDFSPALRPRIPICCPSNRPRLECPQPNSTEATMAVPSSDVSKSISSVASFPAVELPSSYDYW